MCAYYLIFLPAKLAKIPVKSDSQARLCSPEKLRRLGFGAILGPFSVVGEFARVGRRRRFLTRRPGQSGHCSRKTLPEEGTLLQ
jgi:hypothetical protein